MGETACGCSGCVSLLVPEIETRSAGDAANGRPRLRTHKVDSLGGWIVIQAP